MLCRGEGGGRGIVREFGMNMFILLYLKWITNKDLLYSTPGNSAQWYVAAWMRGEFREDWIHTHTHTHTHTYMAQSFCGSPEIITALLISYTPIQNKVKKKRKAESSFSISSTHYLLLTLELATDPANGNSMVWCLL